MLRKGYLTLTYLFKTKARIFGIVGSILCYKGEEILVRGKLFFKLWSIERSITFYSLAFWQLWNISTTPECSSWPPFDIRFVIPWLPCKLVVYSLRTQGRDYGGWGVSLVWTHIPEVASSKLIWKHWHLISWHNAHRPIFALYRTVDPPDW